MATIRKRGSSWQAQVRREGYPPLSKSFPSKAEATAWARDRERSIDRGDLNLPAPEHKKLTVGDLLRRYVEAVTATKRGASPERYRIRILCSHALSCTAVHKL